MVNILIGLVVWVLIVGGCALVPGTVALMVIALVLVAISSWMIGELVTAWWDM